MTIVSNADIAILQYKDFTDSLSRLFRIGGRSQKKFEKVTNIIAGIQQAGLKFLDQRRITKNGETRLVSGVKIDLGDYYRLIIQKHNKCVVFLFVGSHEACDKWLDKNEGIDFTRRSDDGTLQPVYTSLPDSGVVVSPSPKLSSSPLFTKLSPKYQTELLNDVPPLVVVQISQLVGVVTRDQIVSVCSGISDSARNSLVADVLAFLASDNLQNAEFLLDQFYGRKKTLGEQKIEEVLSVPDGDLVRRIVVGSQEYEDWLARFSIEGDPLDWMLFMHPEQQKVVDEDFSGSAQLSGVSGSGKTCIAVRRAARLASDGDKKNVLLVTLNKSLSGLIGKMVDQAITEDSARKRVHVTSFFQLCQEMLAEFEPDRVKLHDSVSWKLDEHIDDVFREFYRCWANSDVAKVLRPIHRSLVAQGICSETYLREEFDWIRTALSEPNRHQYTNAENTPRTGRTHPLMADWRAAILQGLKGWEQKMEAVGVIDYLGLTTALLRHDDKILEKYSNIIVDEAQDFGTTELAILRKLVPEAPNDLFLCGDIAQHILPKHRLLAQANIKTSGGRRSIKRNYRNTRQILEAAYHILYQNLNEEMLERSETDLEFLDPKFANRSSNDPLVLEAETLEEEVSYAMSIVKAQHDNYPNARCCITFAGFTAFEIERFAKKNGIRALDGTADFLSEPLVFSDLEQTKGYEFDLVVIVNCCDGVLPPQNAPEEEEYRDGCRLYVAMTRAKNDLYLSFHGKPSKWLLNAEDKLSFFKWQEVEEKQDSIIGEVPTKIEELEHAESQKFSELSGEQFCLTSGAIGLSVEAQNKICELVDGRGLTRDRKRLKWRNMGNFIYDLSREGRVKAMVGRGRTENEILQKLEGQT
jgi:superfamily I DNA/RNA helicase